MISKKCFSKIIDALKDYYDKVDELFNLLNIQPENFLLHVLDNILDALSNEIETIDEKDKSWLEPMIFEYAFCYNWGRDYKEYFLVKINDLEYKPKTSEELYDCLIKIYHTNKTNS